MAPHQAGFLGTLEAKFQRPLQRVEQDLGLHPRRPRTAVYSLIGWIGFLYLPSLVLIVRGVVRPRRVPANLRG